MPRPVHRDQARSFLVGLIALAAVGAVAYVGATVQGGGELPGKTYTYVRAEFDNVGTLKPQQTVSQHGDRIGQVDQVVYQDGHAMVTMRLDGDRPVYRNASAHIGNESVLGSKFVELDLGEPSAGPLGGRPIPVSRTSDSAALDDVFSVFDRRTRAALSSSLIQLGGGLAGHGDDLRAAVRAAPRMLHDAGTISGALASDDADLAALLESATRLAGRFDGRQRELSELVVQMDKTFRAVNVDGARPLNDTLQALPATLREARQGMRSLNKPLADVRSAIVDIQPGGHALGSSSDNLRGFLREAVGPLGKVPAVGRHATPAVQSLTRTVADARPLVPRLSRTVRSASVLLHDLSPYAPDIGCFVAAHDLLSGTVAPGKHYFSLMLALPGMQSASLPDPSADTVPYPAPGGGAWRDSAASGGTGCP